jgi:uncharacterized membrane protein YqaE (UPF0057 family)
VVLKGLLEVIGIALGLAPVAVYLTVGFKWAVMVGFFLVITFTYGIYSKQVKQEVVGRVR